MVHTRSRKRVRQDASEGQLTDTGSDAASLPSSAAEQESDQRNKKHARSKRLAGSSLRSGCAEASSDSGAIAGASSADSRPSSASTRRSGRSQGASAADRATRYARELTTTGDAALHS
eukprot:4716373-Pleurochrysis_carterae.AAC.1